ncbi:MAG TPA: AMP-binding protein [Glaciihabitans sp.]|jgi:O-succinylbenzoic acid--CoA ligase|nr:AMP-binding protein [Glaciihabitans sp.]
MRSLKVLSAEPQPVLEALRAALSGSGPAILPGAPTTPVPEAVARKIALVVETSGSTATPKRVMLSADALLAGATASESALGGAGQWLLALPVHYIAGLNVLTRSIVASTEPAMVNAERSATDGFPVAFAAAAATLDAPLRFTSLVPAQLAQLMEADVSLPALRRFDHILVGGQATGAHLLERATELGLNLTRTYGSSETAGGCVYNGQPIGNTQIRIVDGQVELSGSVLAEGYLGDDERTAAAFAAEAGQRWYRTGDTGTFDGESLNITGRMDDVIISGGLKVSLADIERAVRELPGQGSAVVVASAHKKWGEVPVLVTTTAIELGPLREYLSGLFGAAAAPDRVVVVAQVPQLSSGKPDRRLIQSLAQ